MKTKIIIILAIAFLNTQCITLHLSDISPNVAVNADITSHVQFDGGLYSEVETSYEKIDQKSNDNSMKLDFKAFTGEHYLKLQVNNPIQIHFNYNVLISKGILSWRLVDAHQKTIWTEDFSGKNGVSANSEEVNLIDEGEYRLYISGKDSQGSYSIQWN